MDWLDDVQTRLKKKNQVLFVKSSDFLQGLTTLIQAQNHRTVVLWALELADETARRLMVKYPLEKRLQAAVDTSRLWAAGEVKMRIAQRAILDAHAVAKEIDSREDIALCHAVGQACGTVHTAGHAMGYPVYELSALVYHYGVDECAGPIEARMNQYISKLLYWHGHYGDHTKWAEFMLAD